MWLGSTKRFKHHVVQHGQLRRQTKIDSIAEIDEVAQDHSTKFVGSAELLDCLDLWLIVGVGEAGSPYG